MIDMACTCGVREDVPESQLGKNWLCPSCGKSAHFICAEPLEDGAGAGDFDASVAVLEGPARVEERFMLGGVVDIQIGKLPDKHILLQSQHVSRNHAVLQRVDFGPSRWKLLDTNSTHGTFVNGERITEHELVPGDRITIGEFELIYQGEAAQPEMPEMSMSQGSHATSSYGSHSAPQTPLAGHAAAPQPGKRRSWFSGWFRRHD